MTKAYDATVRLGGDETFEAWVRLGGASHVGWARKAGYGMGHSSYGKKLHAFTTGVDNQRSFCGKYEASRCTEFGHEDPLPPASCTTCWGIMKLWWQCGRFE